MNGFMKQPPATARTSMQVRTLTTLCFILELLLGRVDLDQFVESNNVEHVFDVFVRLDNDQHAVAFFERVVAVNEHVERAAVEIGDLRQVERDVENVLLKERVDIRLENDRVLEPVYFSDNVDDMKLVRFPAADFHSRTTLI